MTHPHTVREITNRILDLLDEGAIDPRTVVSMCLQHMSEAEVADMAASNDLFPDDDAA